VGAFLPKKKDEKEVDDLITLSEAASLRGTSVSAVSHLVRRQRLASIERYGKVLVSRSEVQGYKPSKGGRPPNPKASGTEGRVVVKKGNKK
jgi:hypothetical protein